MKTSRSVVLHDLAADQIHQLIELAMPAIEGRGGAAGAVRAAATQQDMAAAHCIIAVAELTG